MKHLVTATIAAATLTLACCTPAAAESATDTCTKWSHGAHAIMEARQNGYPMSKLMAKADQYQTGPFGKKLVALAYEQPRYSTEKYQEREADDFANDVFSFCYRKLSQ